jgi:hypothetical protein
VRRHPLRLLIGSPTDQPVDRLPDQVAVRTGSIAST